MTNQKFSSLLKDNIHFYKEYLITEIDSNSKYKNLITDLYRLPIDYADWLHKTNVTNFDVVKFPDNLGKASLEISPDYIDRIKLETNHISAAEKAPYFFLSKNEYKTYKEACDYFPGDYFVLPKNIIKSIDKYIISLLKEFKKKNGISNTYSLELQNGISLNAVIDSSLINTSIKNVSGYVFPDLYLEIDETEFRFSSSNLDLFRLLFLNGTCFFFFHLISMDIEVKDDQITAYNRKTDEPLIYHFESENKYVVSNSFENLQLYNQYIYCSCEIYVEVLNVFVKWLEKIFIPALLHK